MAGISSNQPMPKWLEAKAYWKLSYKEYDEIEVSNKQYEKVVQFIGSWRCWIKRISNRFNTKNIKKGD